MKYDLTLACLRNDMGFGGYKGLTEFKEILSFNIQAQGTRATLFFLTAMSLILVFIISRWMVSTAYGKVLVAVRDAESRTRFLGYRVEHFKHVVFTVAAAMAVLAGALYVPQVGIINPSEFSSTNSIESVSWGALGGRGKLVGAALGAVTVNFLKSVFTTGALAPYWLFALGGLFVVVTLLLPRGILGAASDILAKMRKQKPEAPETGRLQAAE